MLWKAKNRERDALEMRLDRWFVLASGVIPLALFVIKTRLATWLRSAHVVDDCLPRFRVSISGAGKPMNLPKLLLFAGLVPLQWLAFGYAARFGADGITRAGIALGCFIPCSITG